MVHFDQQHHAQARTKGQRPPAGGKAVALKQRQQGQKQGRRQQRFHVVQACHGGGHRQEADQEGGKEGKPVIEDLARQHKGQDDDGAQHGDVGAKGGLLAAAEKPVGGLRQQVEARRAVLVEHRRLKQALPGSGGQRLGHEDGLFQVARGVTADQHHVVVDPIGTAAYGKQHDDRKAEIDEQDGVGALARQRHGGACRCARLCARQALYHCLIYISVGPTALVPSLQSEMVLCRMNAA